MLPMTTRWCDWLALPLLILAFFSLTLVAANRESVTVDEFRHLSTGVYYWQSGDFSFDSATPPLWKLALSLPAYAAGAEKISPPEKYAAYGGWAPWFMATDFMANNGRAYPSFLLYARLVNILAAGICLVYLYWRARRSFGPAAALYGTAFLAFSPTFLAHSHYATTDIIVCLTLTILVFQLVDFVRRPTWFFLVAVAALLGLSMLCKFSAVLLLFPAAGVIALKSRQLGEAAGDKASRTPGRTVTVFLMPALLAAVTFVLVVNIPFRFAGVGATLADISPRSKILHTVSMTPLGQVPIPLPRAFVEGFDRQKADSDYAEFPAYFRGQWSERGFWYYYLAAFCLKETIPFVLLLVLVLSGKKHAASGSVSRPETILLWFVPVSMFIVLSFLNRLDVGVRYLLPAYPFLCYFYSGYFANRSARKPVRVFLLALLLLHVLSVARVAPHYTAYFNEIIGGPAYGHEYLIDSNLDWGQDLIGLGQYMKKQGIDKVQLAYFGHALPELYGIRYEPLIEAPTPGYVAISASLLQGQPYLLTYLSPPYQSDFDHYSFMRAFNPIARIGYSIMVYRIE